ncbi:latex allergen Hevea brasiliensis [Thecamonas trahens ATCC 50062]|uniref:Latex allergen Hevea brasiliensis n=1 Tax=Thecamonas trahens ATCC 50062 TaxID=461836 RepID=A0A0L0DJL4_THETB|nr:latex allergen Hevea brasiliensis [Thecamonas trahens ATCC 50062]KNC52589.1 latex allergen Hevea brasiliensis [Thecamonas trahens ATCC 50062]|eukprot:XP_013755148.1 latex allergen Hevea brasiliensis [Thecamonas trahens ATCC 50062]
MPSLVAVVAVGTASVVAGVVGFWAAMSPPAPSLEDPPMEPELAPSSRLAVQDREGAWAGEGEARMDDVPYRILSLDGGGVRGVYTAVLLHRLVEACPELLDAVDMIAGTSTGGLLACMLAAGYSPAQCRDIYLKECPYIFSSSLLRRLSPFNAKYGSQPKKAIMEKYLGDTTLGELYKYVVVTAFKLDGKPAPGGLPTFFPPGNWRPALFSNLPLGDRGKVPPDNHVRAVDVAMRTSAAPTYFPMASGYADGAIVTNNPALMAVSKAFSTFDAAQPENCRVLSIGSGTILYSLDVDAYPDLGYVGFGPSLFDVLFESKSLATEINARLLLQNSYHRLDPVLPYRIALDDVTAMDDLVTLAEAVDLSETIEWIRDNWL